MPMLTVQVDAETLQDSVRDLSEEDAYKVIDAIDLTFASVAFTRDLIINRLNSIKGDLAPEKEQQVDDMIAKIKEFE